MFSPGDLLQGPRGRRMLLGLAAILDEDVGRLVFDLAYELDPGKGTTVVRLTFVSEGEPGPEPPAPTVGDAVRALAAVDPTHATSADIDAALAASVDDARYWQPPSGSDVLAALPEVIDAVRPIATFVAQHPPDWWVGERRVEQWAIEWRDPGDPAPIDIDPAMALRKWSDDTDAREEWSRREAIDHPGIAWSGDWWSTPNGLLATTGATDAAQPVGLRCVEDPPGWEAATAIPVRGAGRTYEIRTAEDWAALCRRFPREVTASRRHDWFRATGRDGRWLIPDWQRVATEWDAVHLTVGGYLNAATRTIHVDDEWGSVIGGWGPDVTFWLTEKVRQWEGRVEWRRHDEGWMRVGGW